ncbi:MAG: 16S rRNA (uracil(1498)-N(3))-methyltransferase [Candidatus Omnitrophica bacterium]|nr:16S rRNA (uracil(1498)-N(3))-methyltransferase [Candidatus Omnitrophota bacterium]
MHKFFVKTQDISFNAITIADIEGVHHAKNVLRLKEGASVSVSDSDENTYICIIKKIYPGKLELEIKERLGKNAASRIRFSVACAIPKKSKMDDIIDKLTQLGAERIIPLETEHVIVKLDKDKKQLRRRRWEKIALGAARQSQRSGCPEITPITGFAALISAKLDYDLKVIPTLEGKNTALKEILDSNKPKNILVLIGPEGDFSREEVESAKNAGFIPVSLGNLVLRVETAAVAAASFIMLNNYENH